MSHGAIHSPETLAPPSVSFRNNSDFPVWLFTTTSAYCPNLMNINTGFIIEEGSPGILYKYWWLVPHGSLKSPRCFSALYLNLPPALPARWSLILACWLHTVYQEVLLFRSSAGLSVPFERWKAWKGRPSLVHKGNTRHTLMNTTMVFPFGNRGTLCEY